MTALVVFESMYGNTEKVAHAIAEGLGPHTRVISIDQLADDVLAGVDLLAVGGPTHGHGMSRLQTRRTVKHDGRTAANTEVGVRDRIPALTKKGLIVAAFDTRLDKPKFLTGAASKGIARLLLRHGHILIVPPESFLVTGTEGPLVDGELERARAWGYALGERRRRSSSAA
jgi:flavodoxin